MSVICRACEAGLPLVWDVQARKTMHLAQGLSTTLCERLEADRRAHEQRQRAVDNDRRNEEGRGR